MLQKWLGLMAALGAGFLVLSNPNGVAAFARGVKTAVGGTEVSITTGGKQAGP